MNLRRVLLDHEMGNLEKIEKEYTSLGLPPEYKQKFLRLLVDSIHRIFDLAIEPWSPDNYEAWNKILKIYETSGNFENLKKNMRELSGKIAEEDAASERLEEYARQHREDS